MHIYLAKITERAKIEVYHDDDKIIDEFSVPIKVKLEGMSMSLSLIEAEELASKLESTIQDYRVTVLEK